MRLDISELVTAFPDFRVALVVADDLEIRPERQAELAALIAEREAETRRRWGATELSEIPGVAAWRRAYRAFGIKKTSYRSSVERLVKNVLADRPLPAINSFVDAYNAVSLTHVLPLGADDIDRISGDLAFRFARPGDSFFDMAAGEDGAGASAEDPPKEGEVVYADAEKVLCRRWNWRQDARSLVTPETRRAVVTLQANGEGALEAAIDDLVDLAGRFSAARIRVAIADRAAQSVEIV
ncbi:MULTISPECIES: B3/B4 domain-containing protein [Kaistia]|uniref:Phenylalanine--tRNA ligase beta subunit-related protein n=1 Tax=Kaistia nematophila TaxID=2994654 RepID=A0A9X3IKI1_9HYPH|nr:phenylalanine--tRNA ligase beta subunit-related protein [Kaistia nematophila]MCX5569493.1 phenylalanine--tRNA ligase beta subunit-related protein [Kaistia nematophila]